MSEKNIRHSKLLAVAAAAAITLPAAGSVILASEAEPSTPDVSIDSTNGSQVMNTSVIEVDPSSTDELAVEPSVPSYELQQTNTGAPVSTDDTTFENNLVREVQAELSEAPNEPEDVANTSDSLETEQSPNPGELIANPVEDSVSTEMNISKASDQKSSLEIQLEKNDVTIILPEQNYESLNNDNASLTIEKSFYKNEKTNDDIFGTIFSLDSEAGSAEFTSYLFTANDWNKLNDGSYDQNLYYPKSKEIPQPVFKFKDESLGGMNIYSVSLNAFKDKLSVSLDGLRLTDHYQFDFKLPYSIEEYIAPYWVDKSGYLNFSKGPLNYQIFNKDTVNVYGSIDDSTSEITIQNQVEYEGKSYDVQMIGFLRDYNAFPELGKWSSSFDQMTALKKVNIESGISNIQGEAFSGCSKLESIKLPENIQLGRGAFTNCSNLIEVTIPSRVEVSRDCFSNCENLAKVTLENGVNKIHMFAFWNCPNLSMIKIPESVTEIAGNDTDALAFSGSEQVVIFGVPGSEAEKYANKYGIEFRSLEEIEVFDQFNPVYDEILDYINGDDLINLRNILVADGNYCCSIVVNKNSGNPIKGMTEFVSHLLFNGYDGFKEIIAKDTSTDEAVKILANLLSNVAEADSDNAFYTLLKEVTKHILTDLQNNLALSEFKDVMTSDVISSFSNSGRKLNDADQAGIFLNLLIDGDSKKIADFLGSGIKNPKTLNKLTDNIDSYIKNGKVNKSLGKFMSGMGLTVDFAGAGIDTITRFIQYQSLMNSNEEVFNLLKYIESNTTYDPLKTAAKTVRGSLESSLKQALSTLKPLIDEGLAIGYDKALDMAVSAIPFGTLIKGAADLGVDLGNTFFHTKDIQKTYDQMKIATYLNEVLSRWARDKVYEFSDAVIDDNEEEIYKASRKYYDSLVLLHKSRTKGENIYLNHLEALTFAGIPTKEIAQSKEITNQALNFLEYLERNVLEHKTAKKLITLTASCPINIVVHDKTGAVIETIDGQNVRSDFINDIYYSVVYNDQNGDYDKYIVYPEDSGYEFIFTGTDLGVIDLSYGLFDDQGLLHFHSLPNIPVQNKENLKLTALNSDRKLSLQRLDKDSKVIDTLNPVERSTYIAGESISPNMEHVTGEIGDRFLLNAGVLPIDTTNCDVIWSVDDPLVAYVNDDGVLYLLKEGDTLVKAETLDGLTIIIPVNVLKETDNIVDKPGSEIKKPDSNHNEKPSSADKSSQSTVTTLSVKQIKNQPSTNIAAVNSSKANDVPTAHSSGLFITISGLMSGLAGILYTFRKRKPE